MTKPGSTVLDAAVAPTDDETRMDDYLRTESGRAAVGRGLEDIEQGRVLVGPGALEAELARRASSRRKKP